MSLKSTHKSLLPKVTFTAWTLFEEGASTMEIADILKVSEHRVYNAISRARQRWFDAGVVPRKNKKSPVYGANSSNAGE